MMLNVYGSPYTCTVLLQGVGLRKPYWFALRPSRVWILWIYLM